MKPNSRAWIDYGRAVDRLTQTARRVGLAVSVQTTTIREVGARGALGVPSTTVGRAARYVNKCPVCGRVIKGPAIWRHIGRSHGVRALAQARREAK